MPTRTLTDRELNRALLHRQFLLRRVALDPVGAVEHLVGMQAQSPNAPYIGLWARLDGFDPDHAVEAIVDRRLVRCSLMRGTIHLVSARDCRALQPLTQPISTRAVQATPGGPPEHKLDAILAAAVDLLEEQPRTLVELRRLLGERHPDGDPQAMARAARFLLPLVHVPPKGLWGQGGQARLTTVRAWLGHDVETKGDAAAMVRRYLAAFGPATVKDMQTWCGLTGLREVVADISGDLRTVLDETGAELFDLPDAPLPDPDTPAPVRLLPEYDNALRSHANRRRIMTDAHRALLFATKNDAPMPAFLVDGHVAGTWRLDRTRTAATIQIMPYAKLSKKDKAAVGREAEHLLGLTAPGASTREVRVSAPET